MKLYEINDRIDEILERGFAFEEETGEFWDMDDLDSLDMALDLKLESCALAYKNLKAEADALEAEEKTFKARKEAAKKKAERLQGYILLNLNRSGKTALETNLCKVTTRASSHVNVTDEDSLPEEFIRLKIERKPDLRAIAKAIKEERVVPGAELVRDRTVTIK